MAVAAVDTGAVRRCASLRRRPSSRWQALVLLLVVLTAPSSFRGGDNNDNSFALVFVVRGDDDVVVPPPAATDDPTTGSASSSTSPSPSQEPEIEEPTDPPFLFFPPLPSPPSDGDDDGRLQNGTSTSTEEEETAASDTTTSPPTNSICSNATRIDVTTTAASGSKSFTDSGDTSLIEFAAGGDAPNTPVNAEVCSYVADAASTKTVWYYVVGDGSCWKVSTEGSKFDTVLAVYEQRKTESRDDAGISPACDGDWTCLVQNDDVSGSFDLKSVVSFEAERGNAYYIAVSGQNNNSGAYTVVASAVTCPTNVRCRNATGIDETATTANPFQEVSNYVYGSVVEPPAYVCSAVAANEKALWYKVSAAEATNASETTTATTSCIRANLDRANFDTLFALFVGPCDDMTCLKQRLGASTIAWTASTSQTYQLLVGGTSNDASDFELVVEVRTNRAPLLFCTLATTRPLPSHIPSALLFCLFRSSIVPRMGIVPMRRLLVSFLSNPRRGRMIFQMPSARRVLPLPVPPSSRRRAARGSDSLETVAATERTSANKTPLIL